MDFEVFTYGGGEFLRITFNAIAAMLNNGDYIVALKTAAMMGLIVVLIQAAFKGSVLNFPWLIAIIFAFYAALLPRATVIITDRVDTSQSSVVDNVPLGLALSAGFASTFGDWMARSMETLFALPDDMEYTKHGMLFGSRLVEASTHFEITDARTQENLSEFWQQCVFYDVLLGRYTWDDLYWHRNDVGMWEFIQGHTSIIRAFPYLAANGSRSTPVCKDAVDPVSGPLALDVINAVELARKYYGLNLAGNQGGTADEAIAKFSAAMPVSYQYLTGLSMSAEQIIRQNALANSMKRGVSAWAAKVDAPAAAQDYAIARADAERRTAYGAMGELASRMLPMVKNILEAFIYAVFPIVGLMLMLPVGGQVAIGYVKMLVWVQLWAPLYAILHSAVSIFSRLPSESVLTNYTAAGPEKVLSLANYTGLAQVLSDQAILAGYLTMSIPMIAYMLVSAGGSMAAGIVGRIMQSYEAPISQGANEATTGNISLGNTSLGNANWWAQNTAPSTNMGSMQYTGPDGVRRTMTSQGEVVDIPTSNLPFNANVEQAVKDTTTRMASEEVTRASQTVGQYSEQSQSSFQQMKSFTDQLQNNKGFAANFGSTESANLVENFNRTLGMQDKFARENGLSQEQAAAVLGTVTGGAGISTPVFKAAIEGKLADKSEAKINEVVKNAQEFSTQTGYGRQLGQTIEGVRQTTATYSGQNAVSDVNGVTSASMRLDSAGKTLSESLGKAEKYSEARQLAETAGVSFSGNLNGAFREYTAETFMKGDRAAFDRLQQQGARGDADALRRIEGYRGAFASNVAEGLAGIGPAPTAQGIEDRGQAAIANLVSSARGQVNEANAGNNAAVPSAGSRGQVAAATASIKGHNEDARNANSGELNRESLNTGAIQAAGAENVKTELQNREDKSLAGLAVSGAVKSFKNDDLIKAVETVAGKSKQ